MRLGLLACWFLACASPPRETARGDRRVSHPDHDGGTEAATPAPAAPDAGVSSADGGGPATAPTPPTSPASATAPPTAPAPAVGIRRVEDVDPAREAAARELVRSLRADWQRERRRRPRGPVASARADVVAAELEGAIAALAMTLCTGFPAPRRDAMSRLESLAERVLDAAEGIDPRAGQRCLREGGDPADCELIDGQQYTELGSAESELEQARRRASIETLQAECAVGDPDLAEPDPLGAGPRVTRP